MTNEDDLYRVEGSKVWMSPTARELLQGLGSGIKGDIERAKYLRMRHRIQQAALSPSGIGVHSDELAPYLAAPSGLPQEYEPATGAAKQEPPPPDMPLRGEGLQTDRPID